MKKRLFQFSLLFTGLLTACIFDSEDEEEWDAAKVCPETGTNSYGMPNRGSFTDERDGQVYKYTTIGNQVWMAQNLNYDIEGSSCLFQEDNCVERGRHYPFALVMGGGLCPKGWHVPSLDEWDKLVKSVDGPGVGAVHLKSTSGWNPLNPGERSNGNDECGFSALPVSREKAVHQGYDAFFMTSTDRCDLGSDCENYSRYFYAKRMESKSDSITQNYYLVQYGENQAIRCVKD